MKQLKLFLSQLKSLIDEILIDRHIVYRIVDICQEKQEILLQLKGKNVHFKQNFHQAIFESKLTHGLSAEQACWLGIYYGRAFRRAQANDNAIRYLQRPSPNLLLSAQTGEIKIESENRDGSLTYRHTKHHLSFQESPATLAKNHQLIKRFHPNQACYIGILAGIALEKQEKIHHSRRVGHLRIVES